MVKFLAAIAIGLGIWLLPKPEGVTPQGWKLLAIFIATIIGIIAKPFPMGVISIFALTIATVTNTITLNVACAGFGNEVVWLVIFAFFISKAVILSGLGSRLAYKIMSRLGKNSLGLGYGLIATDLILAPCIPSVVARAGGIVYPILKSLIEVFSGKLHDPKLSSFLSLTAFQGTAITCAMFVTGMAGNALILQIAQEQNISVTWMNWAAAAFVPGILTLLVLPYFLYRLWPPVIQKTPYARDLALEKLRAMGPMSSKEKIVASVFVLLLILWVGGPFFGFKPTVAAMVGLSILLLTKVLHWKEILEEHGAWDTLIWFSTLVALASQLNTTGISGWFCQQVVSSISGFHWIWGFSILILIYFYSHYFFASAVAHIGAFFAPFLLLGIALGTPPLLAALVLGFMSNLFMGLTHFGSSAAPIFYNAGHVSVGQWWKAGAACSILFLVIWLGIGSLWWKFLGIW